MSLGFYFPSPSHPHPHRTREIDKCKHGEIASHHYGHNHLLRIEWLITSIMKENPRHILRVLLKRPRECDGDGDGESDGHGHERELPEKEHQTEYNAGTKPYHEIHRKSTKTTEVVVVFLCREESMRSIHTHTHTRHVYCLPAMYCMMSGCAGENMSPMARSGK